MALVVKDILKRPHFRNIQILGGKSGLDREMKWVHIVEIENFGHLLNGEEMILTTGVKWAKDTAKGLHFLQQLIDYHASVLCIDFNDKTDTLPPEMIELAEENNFPIIIFNEEVKFIDITKDIHQTLLRTRKTSGGSWKICQKG
jgi:purine catabolism regulator